MLSAVAALLVGMLDAGNVPHQLTLTIVACIGPMQVAGRLLLLMTERRWSPAATTRIVLWLPALGLATLVLFFVSGTPGWIALAFAGAAIYGAGNGMLTIIKGTAVADMVGPQRVATLNGIAAIPSAFCRAAGPFLSAALWDQTGSITLALSALTLVAAASALSFIAAQRHSKH